MDTLNATENLYDLRIHGMTCAACQSHVELATTSVPGVGSASVNLMAHTAHVITTSPVPPDSLIAAVRNSGYDASLPTGMASQGTDDAKTMSGPPHLGLRALLSLS